ncbi:cell death abnormality protein 1-like [Lingula anatina]|uniref:Cell death abnormality protein 1-like n=1 Tax=Lingula anatina TaxID=7574 RepID=A0A1S3HNN9_LINAN|nr:cell death abnormality protein 1-like [Lingula anatina]|eukprot:XP_013386649.1 cell death abnormality protein 1-like [Lingula anatina]
MLVYIRLYYGIPFIQGEDVIKGVERLGCSTELDCNITNGVCLEGLCRCERGYYAPYDARVCEKEQVVGTFCQDDTDCVNGTSPWACIGFRCRCASEGFYAIEGRDSLCKNTRPKVGMTCTSDDFCREKLQTKYSYCTKTGSRGVCRCRYPYHGTNGDRECIIKAGVGLKGCMGNDLCNQYNTDSVKLICQRASLWVLGTCVCPHGAYGALGSLTCKNETVIGTFCNKTIDTSLCQSAINDSQCLDGRCQCKSGFYGKEAGKNCTYTQVVGLECQNDTDCSRVNNTICENKKCSCLRGYYAEEGEHACKEVLLGTPCVVGNVGFCPTAVNHSHCDFETDTCVCKKGYFNETLYECLKVTLGTHCNDSAKCSNTIMNSTCKATICQCQSGFYNSSLEMCEKVVIGSPCSVDSSCSNVPNTRCLGGMCVCNDTAYHHKETDSCKIKKDLGQHCDGDVEQECRTPNASCMAGTCSCLLGFYKHQPNITKPWTCLPKSLVGQNCTSEHGFDVCNDTNAACNGGEFPKVDFNQSCQSTGECLDIDAVCINNTCDCKNDTYLVSGRFLYCT